MRTWAKHVRPVHSAICSKLLAFGGFMRRIATLLGLLLSLCAVAPRAHANETPRVAPSPTQPSPTQPSQPAPTEAVPEPQQIAPDAAPQGLVIQEIPAPPPNYETPSSAPVAPPYAQPAPTAPSSAPPPSFTFGPTFAPVAPTPPRPGSREHDGFFFRANLSVMTLSARETAGGQELHIGGQGMGWIVDVGTAIADTNFIVFAELGLATLITERVEVDDVSFATGSGNTVIFSGGFGASYYVMPLNLYVAQSIGIGQLDRQGTFSGGGSTGQGLALRTTVGKEWWVSANWGIGATAFFSFMSLPDSGTSLTVLSAGVGGSATYN